MNVLEKRVLKDGKVLPNNIIKVSSFLNHQIDIDLMEEMAVLVYEHYKEKQVDKIVTIEASGIAFAYACARLFQVPLIFAKKKQSANVEEVYQTQIKSYTKDSNYTVMIEKANCKKGEHVLLVDDFLANGNAMIGLIDILKQAEMNVSGIAIAIEKNFQEGRKRLEEQGYEVYSLAIIDQVEDGAIILHQQEREDS